MSLEREKRASDDGLTSDRLDPEKLVDATTDHRYPDNLAKMRRQRNIAIGAGGATLATLVAGGAFWLGTRSGGESNDTTPTNPEPDASARAVPGVEQPVETDAAPGETDAVEVQTYPEFLMTSTNEEILAEHTLDLNYVNAQGSDWVAEQVRELGSETAVVPAALIWEAMEAGDWRETGYVPTFMLDEAKNRIEFNNTMEDNLSIAMNIFSANRDIINQYGSAESEVIVRGTMVDIIRGGEQSLDCKSDCLDPREHSIFQALMDVVNKSPEGTVFEVVQIFPNSKSDGSSAYGTSISYNYREPGSAPEDGFILPDENAHSLEPMSLYNIEEQMIPDRNGGEPHWDEDNFWSVYDEVSDTAKQYFPQDPHD